jgi:molybdate transport system regulatory protein
MQLAQYQVRMETPMAKPIIRFRVDFDTAHSVGPGKIELLEHIRETGSLSQAGREIGMSYRRAWLLLDSVNTSFRQPAVATNVGGKAGGGATLTDFGAALVDTYRQLEREFNATAAKRFASISSAVTAAKKTAAVTRTPLVRSAAPRRVAAKKGAKKSRGRA